jgi:hypothetical protein
MMDKGVLRSQVFEILRKTPQTHLHAIENEIRHHVEGYDRGDALLVHEVVWELLVQGVLAPGKNSLNLNLPFVHVTDYGTRCLEEGEILAHDPEGYEKRLIAAGGDRIPQVVLDSAREGSQAFRAGLYSACLILLARAAVLLASALAAGLPQVTAGAERGADLLTLRERLAATNPPQELGGRLEAAVDELLAVVHLSQDASGRPSTPPADRDRALAHLLLFPEQCRFAYDLLVWLDQASTTPDR